MGFPTKGTHHGYCGIPGFAAGGVGDNAPGLDDLQITGLKDAVGIRTSKDKLHGTCRVVGEDLRTTAGLDSQSFICFAKRAAP